MRVSRVNVKIARGPHPNQRLKAFASADLSGDGLIIAVTSMRIIGTADGRLIVSWPSRRIDGPSSRPEQNREDADGKTYHHRDVTYPLDTPTRLAIDGAVLGAYRRAIEAGETERIEEFGERRVVA